MYRDPIIPIIDFWLPVIDMFNSPWNRDLKFLIALMMNLVTCHWLTLDHSSSFARSGLFWLFCHALFGALLQAWIMWWCPKIYKYEICPGQWQISLVCSLVFVMEQLIRAINYLERCQSYFLTSSICAIANQCMVENSLFLRSVFSLHKTHLIKNNSAKFFWKFWRQKSTSHSRSMKRNEQRSTFKCTSWPLFLSLGQNKLIL